MRLRNTLVFSLFACCLFLCGLPRAYAGHWTEPDYHVDGRLQAPGTPGADDITRPWGGNAGTSGTDAQRLIATGGTSAAGGSVTTTFTYVPDGPDDHAPPTLTILETGSAHWVGQAIAPGGGRPRNLHNSAEPTPTPTPSDSSDFLLTNWKGGRPRIIRVQAPPVTGTANDGWGDPEVPDPNGQGGTSSGNWLHIYTVAADGTVTIHRTLLATVNPEGAASWDYTAKIISFKITRNTVDITSPDHPEVPVMVGEPNVMAASVGPLPDGAVPTYQWHIPGDVVKDFKEIPGNLNANPVVDYAGYKVDLPTEDLTKQSLQFYWYNGTFEGQTQTVSVDVTVFGQTITITGKCKVYRPQLVDGSFKSKWTTGQLALAGGFITFGVAGSPGITWDAEVNTPNVPNAAGSISFEQMVSPFLFTTSGKNAQGTYTTRSRGSDALDSDDPDPRYYLEEGAPTPIAANNNAKLHDDDSPGVPVTATDRYARMSNTWMQYVMYKPAAADSIWVVLGHLDWTVKFSATRHNNGWVTKYDTPLGAAPTGHDSYDFPHWSERAQDILLTQVG